MPEFRSLIASGNQFVAEHAEDLRKSDSDFTHRAYMINATGLYYYSISDYTKAIEEYSRIISLSAKPVVQDSALIWSTCSYIAQSYFEIGNFDLSKQYFDLANRYVSPRYPDYQYRQAMHMLYEGQCFFSLREYDKAFTAYRRAATLLQQLPYRPRIRNALRSAYAVVARYYNEMEKFDSALMFVRKSVSYHLPNDPYYVSSHLLLGDIYYKQKKYLSATSHYEKALAIANKIYAQHHYDKASALRKLGDVNRAIGNYNEGKYCYQKALAQLTSKQTEEYMPASSSPKESLIILKGLGNLYFLQSGNGRHKALLDSCIRTLELGASFIDGLRKELVNLETKEFIARESMEVYSLGVAAAYSAYKLTGDPQYQEKVFFFMEKSKSNILLDRALDIKAREFAGIPEEVLEEERALLGTLSVLQKELLADNGDKPQQQYLVEQRKYLNFINDLEDRYPAYHHLKYDTKTTVVSDVRNVLSSTEAMVEYFVTDSVIYVIGIDHSGTVVDTVHQDTHFANSVASLLKGLSDPSVGLTAGGEERYLAFARDSHHIYERILHPVLANLAATKLIIIPDGKLCYIPFEVLLISPAAASKIDYSGLRYLLRDYQIKYAYSASLGLERAKAHGRSKESFLGFAPSYEKMGTRTTGATFATLANNQREVQDAAELWDGQLFVDSAASEVAFKQHALSANILHLAAHTIIDDFESSSSGIALLPDAGEDGFLHVYELYGMDLDADLAILSGCETGIGRESGGEGMKSLARAFKFAGCNSIVMSLWKVSDITTRDIMNDFHKNLKSGMEKGQALRMAKLTYLDRSPLASPFYWGAFVLVGDDLPLSAGNKRTPVVMLIMGIAILLLAFFAIKSLRTGKWSRRDKA